MDANSSYSRKMSAIKVMNDQGPFGVGITIELLNNSGSCFICRLAVEVMFGHLSIA